MFIFSSIILFRSIFQYFQLFVIALTLVFGLLILIVLPLNFFTHKHKLSNSSFLVLLIRFFHESFASMTWLKSTYHLYDISPFVFDSYTPVACFILTLGVMSMKECSKEELRTSTFVYGVYISMVLLLDFEIGIVNSFSNQHARHSVKFHKSNLFFTDYEVKRKGWSFDKMLTELLYVLKYNSSFVCYTLEYVLVYALVTVILLWNVKKWVTSGQQGKLVYYSEFCDVRNMFMTCSQFVKHLMCIIIGLIRIHKSLQILIVGFLSIGKGKRLCIFFLFAIRCLLIEF